jgi:iron-sulfur cluster assembly protein
MINFTPEAFQKLENALDPTDIIRVRATVGGCSGLSYSMDIEGEPNSGDAIIGMDGFKVCLDPYSKFLLKDLTIDYVQTSYGYGFKFGDAPNDTVSCDCVKSTTCGK